MKYIFTIFSSSQLRNHDCWFYAPKAGLAPDILINGMGNFSKIKIVGKFAARCGQCLSSTTEGIPVENLIRIPDETVECDVKGVNIK